MQQINCIVVEDEPLALKKTVAYIKQLPYLNLLATFEDGIAAMLYLKDHKVELMFLDINLGHFSGIQLLEATKLECRVIITTAYHDYALKGFELNVADYLLKPFTLDRFIQAIEKVQHYLQQKEPLLAPDFLFIKTEYRLEKVWLNEVLYIEGMRDYRRIFTNSQKIMTLQTFKEFEQLVSPKILCRVHKSYMIGVNKIESIEKDEIKIGDRIIPISDTYKKYFMENIMGRMR